MQRTKTGIDSEGPYELTEISAEPMPFEIGSLERHALSYLGEWNTVSKKEEPFGFYYRIGVKQGVLDADNEPATVLLHFVAPFINKGYSITPQIKTNLDKLIAEAIENSTLVISRSIDNVIGVRVAPPDYMVKELFELQSRRVS